MNESLKNLADEINIIKSQIAKVFIGQTELVDGTLAALFAGGHILIEGVPGLGKTLLVTTLGKILGCKFSRIQFTPDLMPSDITGSHIYNQKEQKFSFIRGPIFTNLLLADEINRSPAKTHSALLEIMQEYQVTIDNQLYKISPPFFVLATQNPVESEGTYALPEAQLDRFLLKLLIHYPSEMEEREILRMHAGPPAQKQEEAAQGGLDPAKVIALMEASARIHVSEAVIAYITSLVRATRNRRDIFLGGSPRAGISLLKTSRVLAVMDGRDFVIPDDIQRMVKPAFRHRLLLTPETEVEGKSVDDVITEVLDTVDVPKEDSSLRRQ